ncbi:hypothetical protein PALB_37280 [Pseudoalteromonas luteoviolacea B = ATCC 29581]|nr:hypothetical protein PALB_37280 [Pseudoalteromonas luteoviolacea B = ATCC 29581]
MVMVFNDGHAIDWTLMMILSCFLMSPLIVLLLALMIRVGEVTLCK